jgi:hypothetical protein
MAFNILKLTKLQELDLSLTNITDDCIQHILKFLTVNLLYK